METNSNPKAKAARVRMRIFLKFFALFSVRECGRASSLSSLDKVMAGDDRAQLLSSNQRRRDTFAFDQLLGKLPRFAVSPYMRTDNSMRGAFDPRP